MENPVALYLSALVSIALMPAIENLQQLEEYLRKTLPEARSIQKLHRNEEGKYIDFVWHQRHFVVKPELQVFELKDARLFITGASMLIQASLLKKDRSEKVLVAVLETIEKAEEMMRSNREQGLALVESAKGSLRKLIIK